MYNHFLNRWYFVVWLWNANIKNQPKVSHGGTELTAGKYISIHCFEFLCIYLRASVRNKFFDSSD